MQRLLVGLLVGWTLLVWATRIDNIVADESLSAGGRTARLALALSFVVLAVAVAIAWVVPAARRAAVPLVGALAGWTVVVWIVRGAGIALGDHDAAFIAVHLVLAVISIALSAAVVRTVRAAPPVPA
ncbi:MAG: hypothetical protein AAGK32_20335 [Actinomycetota bacterium]